MARVTPEEYAKDWGTGLSGSTERIRRGINRTTIAPGQSAAKEQTRYVTGVQSKADLWAKRVAAVPLEDWKKMAIDKGIGRIAQGVASAQPAQVAMATKLLAAVDAAVVEVNKVPKGNIEQSINRAATFMRKMSESKIRG